MNERNMTCTECATAKAQSQSGVYRLSCLGCCTRLVLSARPDRKQAAMLLEAIRRAKGNPGREQVLESVRQHLGKLD